MVGARDNTESIQTIPDHISSSKWIPTTEEAEVLCVGTWGSKANYIQLWQRQRSTRKRTRLDYETTPNSDGNNADHGLTQIASLSLDKVHVNDITIRKYGNGNRTLLYAAGSDGFVRCVTYDPENSGNPSMTSVSVALEIPTTNNTRPSGPLTQITLSAVNKHKCASVLDGRLVCFDWDEAGIRPQGMRYTGSEAGPITAVHWFNRDCVLSAGEDNEVRLWDTRGKDLQAITCTNDSTVDLNKRIQCITSCESTTDHHVYTGDSSGCVVLWDVRNTKHPTITRQVGLGTMLQSGRGGVRQLKVSSRHRQKTMIACVGKELVALHLEDGVLPEEVKPMSIHRDVLPINDVDVHGDVAVWGSDSGELGTCSML